LTRRTITRPAPIQDRQDAAAAPALPIKPAKLEQAQVTRTFPTRFKRRRRGGRRFLILHLPKLRQLAIFDVNEAKGRQVSARQPATMP